MLFLLMRDHQLLLPHIDGLLVLLVAPERLSQSIEAEAMVDAKLRGSTAWHQQVRKE